MKRLLAILLSVFMIFSSAVCASAYTADIAETGKTTYTVGDWSYSLINGDKYWEIAAYKGSDSEIYLPRIVNDTMVVSISNHVFAERTDVNRVYTSSPLWTVGEYAFLNCTSLQEFECNFALKEIKVGAFSGTSSLKKINLEDSIVTEISAHAFMSSGIEEITLPDTCTTLKAYSFAQCPDLAKITIPKSVTFIHEDAFKSSDNVVIYCYTDSYAHEYAVANDIPFVLIDAPVEVTFILGDADNSGNVDIVDATFAQRYVTHSDIPEDILSGMDIRSDIDASGEVEATDVTFIMRHLIRVSTPYPIGEEITRTVKRG